MSPEIENLLTVVLPIVLGLVAPLLVQGVKKLTESYGADLSRVVVSWITFGVSFVLVLVIEPAQLPAIPSVPPASDPVLVTTLITSWLSSWLALIASVSGVAMLVYNVIYRAVFEKLGWK